MKKIALIHDWLVADAGAEKVLQEIYSLFPSPIYTLFYKKKAFATLFDKAPVFPSFLQRFPRIFTKYPYYLFFFPKAIQSFSLNNYDMLLSSSHCVAKGIKTKKHQLHICYCHTPMRYIWDLEDLYLQNCNRMKKTLLKWLFKRLRFFDRLTSLNVDYFIANSHFVAKRIQKVYKREAKVIYPPVDTEYFSLQRQKGNYYMTASRLVAYKGIEEIVRAFNQMPEKQLFIAGEGPEKKKLQKIAGKNCKLLGYVSQSDLKSLLQKAKAFVFNSIEDFGILPVEAQATGTPVIALHKGGIKETVLKNSTGIFYEESTADCIQEAVYSFEKKKWDPVFIRNQALRFSKERFLKEYKSYIENLAKRHF